MLGAQPGHLRAMRVLGALPADAIGPKMARLRPEHHPMLGSGYCTRAAELGCAFESICEPAR
ncbi:MAG: hypothetical protein ACLP5E_01800, partial [Streptosporangiaceae bacterium]